MCAGMHKYKWVFKMRKNIVKNPNFFAKTQNKNKN
jgi:hypothetical protein